MSARLLSDIRASVRDILRDEFVEGVDIEWESDELDRLISITLREVEQRIPYEVKATTLDDATDIETTANSKEIDISGIADIIRVVKAEYRTGKNPKQFRNVTVFGDTLTFDMNILPSSAEAVYLYLHKKHTLTDATSTLKPDAEAVLVQGVVARAAMNKGREQLNALNVGGVNVGPRMVEWGREQLALYRRELKRNTKIQVYEALPKD